MDAACLQTRSAKVLFLLNMQWIYLIAVKLYSFLIWLVSPFNNKAALWIKGRKRIFEKIENKLGKDSSKRIWFHCASLGEFEQAVPLIKKLKQKYPSHKFILTFFSPSGYELKKNTSLADYVFYLPADGPANARRFLNMIKPEMVFFIKYEFWHFYIHELYSRNIPLYFISARFRKNQIFFKGYGRFFRAMLRKAKHIFVQDENSLQLCFHAGIKNCSVSGDTRYDRVMEIASNPKQFPEIAKFSSGKKVFIAGSTWPEDEKLLFDMINHSKDDWKFIIVPHEISESHISFLISGIRKKTVRYSKLNNTENDVMIIDNIGMLSSAYQYGDTAYVGGGLGRGLHNILEPAAYGLPVIFGNRIDKNPEAKAMIKNGTGFTVSSTEELKSVFDKLNESNSLSELKIGQRNYVAERAGAIEKIIGHLTTY